MGLTAITQNLWDGSARLEQHLEIEAELHMKWHWPPIHPGHLYPALTR